MGAIIWKELRENLKWAVLWMSAVGAAMVYALSQANPYFDQSPSICSAGFLTVTTFGSIAGGSLLGILQIVTELRRDRWAFLIHRPVGRTTIFVGKVVGGLTLYSLAMGIPLLGAAVWAATPGSVAAPFDSRMLLPGFADVLTGTAFYFAGMLTGIRQARWYGSRALGIVAAVLCAILVLNVAKEFRHAVLAVLAFDVLLSCAAWGGFLSDGENGRQPRPVRAILGVCLFVGIAVLSAAGVAIIGAFLPGQDTWISTDYAFHRDGTVLRVTTDIHGVQEVTDLGGKEIPEYRDARARADFHRNTAQTTYIRWSDPKHGPSYRNCERWFSLLAYGQDAHWYFIEDEGLFRGFSTRDRREVGTLGPDGLASVGAEPGRRFQGRRVRTWGGLPLAFPKAVYEIDAISREVKLIYAAKAGEEVLGTGEFIVDTDAGSSTVLAVVTHDSIYVVTHDGEVRFRSDIPFDSTNYPNVQAGQLDGGRHVLRYSPPFSMPDFSTLPEMAVVISSDGRELAQVEQF